MKAKEKILTGKGEGFLVAVGKSSKDTEGQWSLLQLALTSVVCDPYLCQREARAHAVGGELVAPQVMCP